MKPSVGRIVHYVARGSADGVFQPEHRAAIITEVWSENTVGLAIINPTGMYFERSMSYDPSCTPGTWHWPELVLPDALLGRDDEPE